MTKLGILPAAGKSTRFGGIFKELLPVGKDETLISRAVDTLKMAGVDNVLVVTSHYKVAAHSMALQNYNVKYAVQRDYSHDVWGAIIESFDMSADRNYYLMPDTLIPSGCLPMETEADFTLGIFTTLTPQNYGVLLNGEITDKDTTISGVQQAWGALIWSMNVVRFWKKWIAGITSHTQAFNMAMSEFGYDLFEIPEYHDIGSFDAYKEFIAHV